MNTRIFRILAILMAFPPCFLHGQTLMDFPGISANSLSQGPSLNQITAFAMGKKELMWIGTENDGVYTFDGTNFRSFREKETSSTALPSYHIRRLFADSREEVWAGTDRGLARYVRYGRFKNYLWRGRDIGSVSQLAETRDRIVLVGTPTQLFYVSEADSLVLLEHIPVDSPDSPVIPDRDGGFWLCGADVFRHYDRDFRLIADISVSEGSRIPPLAAAQDQFLWTVRSGVLSCRDLGSGELLYRHAAETLEAADLMFLNDPRIYIKSSLHGISCFDTRTRRFEQLGSRSGQDKDITCFYKDRLENVWVGYAHYSFRYLRQIDQTLAEMNDTPLREATRGHYIEALAPGTDSSFWGSTPEAVFSYDPQSGQFRSFPAAELLPDTGARKPVIHKLLPAAEHQLWLLTQDRIVLASAESGRLRARWSRPLPQGMKDAVLLGERCLVSAPGEHLLAFHPDGTADSLKISQTGYGAGSRLAVLQDGGLLLSLPGFRFLHLRPGASALPDTSGFSIPGLCRTADITDMSEIDGTVYAAADDGGLFAIDPGKRSGHALPYLGTVHIASIQPGNGGSLLMGTDQGIIRYQPADSSLSVHSLYLEGKRINAFTRAGAFRTGDRLLLGSSDGVVVFPSMFDEQPHDHHTSIHSMSVLNKQGSQMILLPEGEKYCHLRHRQNSFLIRFGSVSYDAQPIKIEYLLEDCDAGWMDPGTSRYASYSNVPAGKHVFRVRELQPLTGRVLHEEEMLITIQQAPWLTVPALLLYFVLLAGILYYVLWTRFRIKSGKLELEVANKEKELERRTNQMNISFFANIAHEFRNPLTIISGPLYSLAKDPTLSEDGRRKVRAITQSSNTMLRLIDQMLDFNQLETDELKLRVGQHDIAHELSLLAETFEESARPRAVSLELKGLEQPFITTLDADKFEKILENLFTNAMKHVPDGGVIALALDDITGEEARQIFGKPGLTAASYCRVSLTNNGRQIPEDKLPTVFMRYYQVAGSYENHEYGWGRGIGLNYVERMVGLHHGAIRVDNVPGGVRFSFILPVDAGVYAGALQENDKVHKTLQIPLSRSENARPSAANADPLKPRLLIVDDDVQIAQYLQSIFEDSFRLFNRYSAEAAWQDLESIAPDIIISDVVMGRMSGYDLCREIKSSLAFSHIPVILLTAKSEVSDSVSGLEAGASAYVSKPFSEEYLKALVHSQLKNVENIRAALNGGTEVPVADGMLSAQDRQFMTELYQLMDSHIKEADFNVESICRELRISRSKFTYKLKGLTGATPGTFFRQYKMNKAAKLLREGRYNVSEIADMLGFTAVSSFSSSFKKIFGISPSEY